MITSEHLNKIKAKCEQLLETECHSILARRQPCGCLVCNCADDEQCHGCGAKNCGTHPVGSIPNPVYLKRRPSHAEAGWRSTIALVDWFNQLQELKYPATAEQKLISEILTAWPEELL